MVSELYPRILQPPAKSFFLFGVRGSGKSTWTGLQFPEAPRVDLLDERLYTDITLNPGTFAGLIEAVTPGSWVVVDEIQRLPGLLNLVHKYIEERRLRFVLTGSSSRKLYGAGVNLLAGRALLRQMYPFVPEELGADFDLDRILQFGSLPIIWAEAEPQESLDAFVQLYLKDEIRGEGLVRNFPSFARFFQVASLMHGQVLNLSSLARDSGVARSTLQDHLNILESTYVTFQVPAFESRIRVRQRRLPKLYWIDPGIVRAARGLRGEPGHEERGAILEGWIASLLRTYGDIRGLFDEMSYWSPHQSNVEVDFVLRKGRELLAIEVKEAKRVKPEHLAGLRAIGEEKAVKRRILVYLGQDRLSLDGIEAWPIHVFLQSLQTGALWPR